MAPSKLVLFYFDFPGRAEPIRWILAQSGLKWEDKRLSEEEFGELKHTFPNGQVPVLEIDGYPLPESHAIILYVSRIGDFPTEKLHPGTLSLEQRRMIERDVVHSDPKTKPMDVETTLERGNPRLVLKQAVAEHYHRLYPTDYLEAAKCDAILGCFQDMWVNLRPLIYEKDEARKMEFRAEFVDHFLPTWLDNMEKKLGQTEGFYFLDKMTVADISMANVMRLLKVGGYLPVTPSVFDACPKLMALTESIMAEPKIAELIAKTGTPK